MASVAAAPSVMQIPLDSLVPSPFNARKHFDRPALAELAASIKAEGIQNPLIVRKAPDGKSYEIIAGERRYRAAEIAELKSAPCIVRQVDELEARRIQIIENLQRQDISPLEEAQAFQDLLKAKGQFVTESGGNAKGEGVQAGPTVEAIAKELGKSKEYVYGRLKLLKLGEMAHKALAKGQITAGHAVELVSLPEEKQEEAIDFLLEQGVDENGATDVSVMTLRDEIKYSINPPPRPAKSAAQIAADERFNEQQAKERKEHERRADAQRKQADFDRRVDERMLALLWPKLKAMDAKTREALIDNAIARAAGDSELRKAQRVAAGKPYQVDGYEPADRKAFNKAPRAERLALLALSVTIGNLGWRQKENEATWKWAKLDRKKIAAELKAAEGKVDKANARADAAGMKRVQAALSTSAKPKPKAKAKAAAKTAKGKRSRGKATRKK